MDLENDTITANGVQIQVIYSDNPATVDYTAYGIHDALVVDNTGRWRDPRACPSTCRARASPGSCSRLRARAS